MAVGTMTALMIGGALVGGAVASRTGGSGGQQSTGRTAIGRGRRADQPDDEGATAVGTAQSRRTPGSPTVGTAQPREGAGNGDTVGGTNPPDAGRDAQNASQAARIAAQGARRRAAGFNRPLLLGERSSITPPKARLNRRTLVGF